MSLLRNDFPCAGGVSLLFDQPVSLLANLRDAVAMLTALAAERLQRDRLLTRQITVWIETQYRDPTGPEVCSRIIDLPVPVSDPRLLTVFTRDAAEELYRPGTRYRAAGVYCEDLTVDEGAVAAQLDNAGRRAARPYGALHRIIARQARRALAPAGSSTLPTAYRI
jgi:impB/mucB/samB family C-terminal domain